MQRLPGIRELFSESFLLSNGIRLESSMSHPPSSCTSPPSANVTLHQRHRMSPYQELLLGGIFRRTSYPSSSLRRRLAAQFDLDPRIIQVWFQNRRQKQRGTNRR
ncbi:hypothetical protein DSO57_1015642 [Entomophthora muscae]|uniref:Uncharacterized protein n=2 Tax=Entomophthora muscae TaxID=34485 RepID=A0ACC2STM5_9FUNG|nr:hypothetical protein DSO57_1016479 [Entomophthora muscae]KAJ9065814.1 hypothetical protein DSO57_1015642 [Entomophthora muscae]